jgi:hypothetical protein
LFSITKNEGDNQGDKIGLLGSRLHLAFWGYCFSLQGDQMSLRKSLPKYNPIHFSPKLAEDLYHGKGQPKKFELFQQLYKNFPKKTTAQFAKIRPIWSPYSLYIQFMY